MAELTQLLLWAGTVAVLAHIALSWTRALQAGARSAEKDSAPVLPVESWPAVSVLVPAWREAKTLTRCLSALNQVEYPAWEVIVIAGGPDGTLDVAQAFAQRDAAYSLVVLEQQPLGKNAALSQGLAAATGAIIVTLDADTLVEPTWLQALVAPLQQGFAAACGNYFPLRKTWVSGCEQMEKIESYLINDIVILQGSGSIAIERTALDRVGGFPAAVVVGVDWDLDARIGRHDLRKAFAQDARVYTERPATLREYWRNEIRWRRAHLHSLWERRQWFLRSPQAIFENLIYYLVALVPIVLALGSLALFLLGERRAALFLLLLVLPYLLWLVGRRVALAIGVARYSGDRAWLKLAWAPGVLLVVGIVASWGAILTYRKSTVHFSGPRL